jgi:hypothetical protein
MADVGPGDVGVDQQPHPAGLLGGLQQRGQAPQLVQRPPVVLGERRDLFREALAVRARGAGGARRPGGAPRAAAARRPRRRAAARAAPRRQARFRSPTRAAAPPKRDASEQARLGRLLGELRDDDAARPAGAPERARRAASRVTGAAPPFHRFSHAARASLPSCILLWTAMTGATDTALVAATTPPDTRAYCRACSGLTPTNVRTRVSAFATAVPCAAAMSEDPISRLRWRRRRRRRPVPPLPRPTRRSRSRPP